MVAKDWRPSIPVVVDRQGRRWLAAELERGVAVVERDGIRCAGCGVDATWREAHPRTLTSGRTIDVRLHFRLRHRGSEHGPGCPYDFDRRADAVVRDLGGVIAKRGEIYQLRLPLSSLPQAANAQPGHRRPAPELGPGAGPVLSAALRIVQLLEDFAHQPEASERFRAEYAGQAISWGDFCWHADTTARASELVDELRRRERVGYPIAVWGRARPVVTNATGTQYVTLTRAQHGQTAARIRARDPRVLEGVEAARNLNTAQHVMGYGEWRAVQLGARPQNPLSANARDTAVEAALWANHPSAVACW
jgi:hypothetical protein